MRVDRIKKKSVEEAEKDLAAAHGKLTELESTTARQLWSRELEEFLGAWKRTEKSMIEFLSASTETKKGSGAPSTKARKVIIKRK